MQSKLKPPRKSLIKYQKLDDPNASMFSLFGNASGYRSVVQESEGSHGFFGMKGAVQSGQQESYSVTSATSGGEENTSYDDQYVDQWL